jgi:methylenetetrahydrofolate dehydrogenase (NADP+)/methenyltetrahydrofolate cyclohydrolase
MSGEILDGKKLSKTILENLRFEIEDFTRESILRPRLAVILVGNNPASQIYVNKKEKTARECGIISSVIRLSETVSARELSETIDKLNRDEDITAILLQLPLPKHLNEQEFIDKIHPKKDVDGIHPLNLGKLIAKTSPYAIPCTPLGIIKLLNEYNIEIAGKHAVIVGRSNIVGKPLSQLLLNRDATVTIAHSKTKNLGSITKQADILISATGFEHLITKDMVKKGAVVIDVGTTRGENGKLTGDVDFENVKEIASFITPVPGGVGPMTIATLMQNTFELFKKTNKLSVWL